MEAGRAALPAVVENATSSRDVLPFDKRLHDAESIVLPLKQTKLFSIYISITSVQCLKAFRGCKQRIIASALLLLLL